MKKILLPILLGFTVVSVNAQKWTIPADIVKMYIVNDKLSEVDNLDMLVAVEETSDGFYNFTVSYADTTHNFKLRPLNAESFIIKTKFAFEKVLGTLKQSFKHPSEPERINNYLIELYTSIAVYLRTEEKIPHVATVYLRDSVANIYYDFPNDSSQFQITSLKITDVNLTFFGGFIEKVQVQGEIELKDKKIPIEFNNKFSIGISSTRNVNKLIDIRLFSDIKFSKSVIYDMVRNEVRMLTEQQVLENKRNQSLYITLADVIRYEKFIDVNAHDISPVSSKVTLSPKNAQQKLYRESSSRLFEAKLYTDLLGLIDEENPNGIVQIEMDKRFNINTSRTDFCKGGLGIFQYIDASFNLSKIEADNKYLIPSSFSSSSAIPVFNPVQLYQYRNYSAGAMLNFLYYENQDFKFNWMLDFGLLFGRTGIKTDTMEFAQNFFVNNREIPVETGFHFIPEKRVKFSITDRFSWFKPLSDDIELPLNNQGEPKTASLLNTVTMKLDVDISDNGKLFARYKFVHKFGESQNNYSQLQFGYSFYILKNNGVNKVVSNN